MICEYSYHGSRGETRKINTWGGGVLNQPSFCFASYLLQAGFVVFFFKLKTFEDVQMRNWHTESYTHSAI